MKEKVNSPIDAVIMWVDDRDETWQKEKNHYQQLEEGIQDAGSNRYRDWGTLKYLFRGIETFAPWIRKIYFVTCGQKPDWLNADNPKLVLINHEDFIPNDFLPTFSSPAIDLNLWRIQGLSEFFIFFNDDMFFINNVAIQDFVVNGQCCNMFSERPLFPGNLLFNYSILNSMKLLQQYYRRSEVLRHNKRKILCLNYGVSFFYNLLWMVMPYKKFSTLEAWHLPMAQKKSQWKDVYLRDKEKFDNTCSHKFRKADDVTRFIYCFDQLLSGDFHPVNMMKKGKLFSITDDTNIDLLCNSITHKAYKCICINDECNDESFVEFRRRIIESFEEILPNRSTFEL